MIPNILKSEVMPTVDPAALHSMACEYVEEIFSRKGECPPTWIIAGGAAVGNRVLWIETPWENDRHKVATVKAIRDLLKILQARCYSQISEAWIYASDAIPEPEREHWNNVAHTMGLQNVPDKYRDDVAQVFSFSREIHYLTHYKVTIRRHGPNFLGPRIDDMCNGSTFEGRMWNLLI